MSSDSESRLLALEDRFAIQELIDSYGPAVDTGDVAALQRLWTEDGWYSVDGVRKDAVDLADIIERETHQRFLSAGCAHLMTPPRIELEFDRAVARNYSLVLTGGAAWKTERVSANRWSLVRTAEGWRIHSRTNEVISGPTTVATVFTSSAGLTKID